MSSRAAQTARDLAGIGASARPRLRFGSPSLAVCARDDRRRFRTSERFFHSACVVTTSLSPSSDMVFTWFQNSEPRSLFLSSSRKLRFMLSLKDEMELLGKEDVWNVMAASFGGFDIEAECPGFVGETETRCAVEPALFYSGQRNGIQRRAQGDRHGRVGYLDPGPAPPSLKSRSRANNAFRSAAVNSTVVSLLLAIAFLRRAMEFSAV